MNEKLTNSAPESLTHAQWLSLAQQVEFKTELFIDGDYVEALNGERFDTVNPATGDVLASIACGNEQDIDRAVASSKAAWDDGRWRFMPPRQRMQIMQRLADLVEEHAAEFALLESLDMGKPITDALTIDVPETVVSIRYFAECIDKVQGAVTHTDHNALHIIEREPLGIVGAICSWNYPLLMAMWKIAPALAAGNCVVLKPPQQAPLSCTRFAELFIQAGGPIGVLNVVNGRGSVAGRALGLHMDVAKISFTGSTEVGKQIMVYGGQSNLKRVALETGGKSPQIFMPDLENLDDAVDAAFGGIFDNGGQVCNAGSRLLVHRDIHDVFVEKFTERSLAVYQAGDPLNPATTLGPTVTHAHQRDVINMIDQGRSDGANLVFGGGKPVNMEQGAFVEPTLFTDVDPQMNIAREEIFGPVASVMKFDSEDHAIALANDSIYGLAAGVWTGNLKTGHRMVRALEAGVIWVNCFGDGDMTQPFGGYKQSGNTRDKSIESFEGYMQSKSSWLKLN